jgi:hemin uptake protein HemP
MKNITNIALTAHLELDAITRKGKGGQDVAIQKLSSAKLFGGNNEVMIQHQGDTYVLRLTKQNKLILTK